MADHKSTEKHPAFHISKYWVGFNRDNSDQPIVNVWLKNDGIATDATANLFFEVFSYPPDGNHEQNIRTSIDDFKTHKFAHQGLIFRFDPNSEKYFTIPGPIFSPSAKSDLIHGKYVLYFGGSIEFPSDNSKPLHFCAFVLGNNLDTVIDCPVSARGDF